MKYIYEKRANILIFYTRNDYLIVNNFYNKYLIRYFFNQLFVYT